jgi:hypothetical protein
VNKEDEIFGAHSMHDRSEKFVKILVRKPDVERSLNETRHRLGENTKMEVELIIANVRTVFVWLRIRLSGGRL